METKYVFRNFEMSSKTFIMLLKKLPDHFNKQVATVLNQYIKGAAVMTVIVVLLEYSWLVKTY